MEQEKILSWHLNDSLNVRDFGRLQGIFSGGALFFWLSHTFFKGGPLNLSPPLFPPNHPPQVFRMHFRLSHSQMPPLSSPQKAATVGKSIFVLKANHGKGLKKIFPTIRKRSFSVMVGGILR